MREQGLRGALVTGSDHVAVCRVATLAGRFALRRRRATENQTLELELRGVRAAEQSGSEARAP